MDTQSVNYYTHQHLQELAENPNTLVYTYAYDNPDSVASYTAAQIRELAYTIEAQYESLRQSQPEATDDDLRDLICAKSAKWSHFAKTHKNIFAWITSRDKPNKMEMLEFLVKNKENMEKGKLTESQTNAIVRNYGESKFGKKQPKQRITSNKKNKTAKNKKQNC